MFSFESMLVPGVNFTSRPEMKYARAVHLANEMRGRIDEWHAAETLLARPVALNDNVVEFRAVIKRQPPIDEWSLILGDALHNLRGVLDAAIWGLAHLDGAQPKKPTRVMFPITRNEKSWQEAIASLESVPPIFLERIRLLQSWVDGGEGEDSFVRLLHQYDIDDKHRGLISGGVHFRELQLSGMELNLNPDNRLEDANLTYRMREQPIRLDDEVPVLTLSSASHTIAINPAFRARMRVKFALDVDPSRLLFVDTFLADLFSRMRIWLDQVYGGREYALAQAGLRQASENEIMFGHTDANGKQHFMRMPFVAEPPSEGP